jgi:hypothetical protein
MTMQAQTQTHPNVLVFGGRIRCLRCEASAASGAQCGSPALRGQATCYAHSGRPMGPKTAAGREQCAKAKTVHGRETRQGRIERSLGMRRLRELEDLGHALRIIYGPRTPGRKPASRQPRSRCLTE